MSTFDIAPKYPFVEYNFKRVFRENGQPVLARLYDDVDDQIAIDAFLALMDAGIDELLARAAMERLRNAGLLSQHRTDAES